MNQFFMLVSSFLFFTTFSKVLNFESIEDTRNSLLSVSDNWKKERSTTIGIPIDYSFFLYCSISFMCIRS